MELFECFDQLARKGSIWKAKRIGKKFFNDSIEATTVLEAPDGIFRGVILVTRQKDISQVKADVKFYRDGKMVEGKFKHAQHPSSGTVKVCEYEDEVLFEPSRVFGINLGWKPRKPVSSTHRRLTEIVDGLVVEFDSAEATRKTIQASEKDAQTRANMEVATRALSR